MGREYEVEFGGAGLAELDIAGVERHAVGGIAVHHELRLAGGRDIHARRAADLYGRIVGGEDNLADGLRADHRYADD